jgi:hypothetical protein
LSGQDFRRNHSLIITARERRECPCGCRLRMPWLFGELTGPEGCHAFEAAFVHHQGQRRLLVALRGPLLQGDCAAWAGVAEGAKTTFEPASTIPPGMLLRMRPSIVTGEERLGAVFQLLEVVLFNWLEQTMREVRSSDEHVELVREITDSYLQAQVARSMAKQ